MNFFQNTKKNTLSHFVFISTRYAVFVLLFIGTLILSTPRAQAGGEWGINDAVATNFFDYIRQILSGTLLSAYKIVAVEVLNSRVGQMVAGGGYGGRPLVITNYNDFLYRGPAQRSGLFMNDFFTLTTRGKAYGSNYIPFGGRNNFRGNYSAYLISVGKQSIMESTGINVVNLEEYVPSPELMFAQGDWRAFNAFFSNPANNPYGYALQAQQAYQQKLAMEQEQARIKAMSGGGYLPVERNGMVITPARTIGDVVEHVTTLGNNIIAAASNPYELAGGVILAVTNRMINSLIQRGLGELQSNLHRELGNVDRSIFNYNNQEFEKWGAGVMFFDEQVQRTNAAIKANTPPPPGYVQR